MARGVVGIVEWPRRLAVCRVVEWVEPGDEPDLGWWQAWVRWVRAREEFLHDAGVSRRDAQRLSWADYPDAEERASWRP